MTVLVTASSFLPPPQSTAIRINADTNRIRSILDWKPQFDDLETIAAHALAWEEKLLSERHGELTHAVSA